MSSEQMSAVYIMERNFPKFPQWQLVQRLTTMEYLYDVLKQSDKDYYEKAIEYYRSLGMYEIKPEILETIVHNLQNNIERSRLYNDLAQHRLQRIVERPFRSFYLDHLELTESKMKWKEGLWNKAVEHVQEEPDTSKIAYTPSELPQYCACGIAWDSFLYGSKCASCGEENYKNVAYEIVE
ncbi:hypothetical protein NNO96_17440 [Acinetobacter baumannii]|uniref:hypothetical protein n=1 Tax=Acinetobacter baumannii TaxID=470 RepID=UPI0020CC5D46|nr:hypothetical protein [Acinetobacter baumannii]MCQ1073945.1 hypothetical protein [Acinetobacter baumannii]